MVGLTFSTLKKRDNFLKFKNRILGGKTFEIIKTKKTFYGNDTVIIEQEQDLIEAFEKVYNDYDFSHFKKWSIGGQIILPIRRDSYISNRFISSGHLQKTKEFGSKHTEDLYSREQLELNSLRRELKKLTVLGAYPVSIMIKSLSNKVSWIHDVVDARISLGARGNPPKSDFELLNKKNEVLCRISHKFGTAPNHFRQWSGTREILTNSEITYFGEQLKAELSMLSLFEDNTSRFPSYTFGRLIEDESLKRYALFGNKNEVDLIVQGKISFVPCATSDTFSNNSSTTSVTLQASLVVHKNDSIEDLPDGYQPAIMAFTGCDRAAFGIPGCRLAIYPQAGRKITKNIK